MSLINPPRNQDDYPDRFVDCQEALEPAFHVLMADAMAHGWGPKETRRALWRLIAAHQVAEVENAKLDTELALIRASQRARRL